MLPFRAHQQAVRHQSLDVYTHDEFDDAHAYYSEYRPHDGHFHYDCQDILLHTKYDYYTMSCLGHTPRRGRVVLQPQSDNVLTFRSHAVLALPAACCVSLPQYS